MRNQNHPTRPDPEPVPVPVRRALFSSHQETAWAIWAVAAAFGCYFCMYAFRKPFTAGAYEGSEVWGTGFKTILVVSQVMGYTLSKFIGIRVIAEMPPHRRAVTLMWLVGLSEVALVLFGLLPRPWNAIGLFLNGLPLGMVFGLVLGFLEGRRATEFLAAGLCASFILADGVTKSLGTWLLQRQIPEDWMPALAGALFLVPLSVCVWMLARIPPPGEADVAARAARYPMNREERWRFLRRYGFGILMLVIVYLLVTVLRSVRADFAPEIWKGLGGIAAPGTFAWSEMWVALGILAANGAVVGLRNNRLAFFVALATCALGFVLMPVAAYGWNSGRMSGFSFMVLVGLGLYLPYVAIHTTVFERMLAMTRERGNVGFLMYVVDSLGYLGYVAVMLLKNSGASGAGMLDWLLTAIGWSSAISLFCLLFAAGYFARTGPAPATAEP